MGRGRRVRLLVVALLGVLLAGGLSACDPPPVKIEQIATGLDAPVAFALEPNNGYIVYGERNTGEIRRRNLLSGADQLVWTVPSIAGGGERGLVGLTLDAQYPTRRSVYVYAARTVGGAVRNQVLRIAVGSNFVGTSQTVIYDEAGPSDHHIGGRLAAGPDGKLYLAVGEYTNPANAQDLGNTAGKILRMETNGAAPADNPIAGKRIFAYGIRNSFGFDFDPANGRLWATDNGPTCNDEVNRIVAGGNYGWGPRATCSTPPSAPQNTNQDGPGPRLPLRFYASPVGITGAVFCDDCGIDGLDGRLLVGAVNNGNIRVLTLDGDRTGVSADQLLVDHSQGVISMEARPGSPVYFSTGTGIYRLAPA